MRDEASGMYAAGEQTTDEFGAMMRDVEVGRVRERLDHLQAAPDADLLDVPGYEQARYEQAEYEQHPHYEPGYGPEDYR
ncbi:MAG: hypothetical protein JHD16_14810 [Solirubrobacteraceae bacterium]|nr:hypothetical protein [Solirubrobacteraceae bacterium]